MIAVVLVALLLVMCGRMLHAAREMCNESPFRHIPKEAPSWLNQCVTC